MSNDEKVILRPEDREKILRSLRELVGRMPKITTKIPDDARVGYLRFSTILTSMPQDADAGPLDTDQLWFVMVSDDGEGNVSAGVAPYEPFLRELEGLVGDVEATLPNEDDVTDVVDTSSNQTFN